MTATRSMGRHHRGCAIRVGSRSRFGVARVANPLTAIGNPENPLRVAIVGSGPSGFYAAGHLLKAKSHPDLAVQVDVFDRLPTPWGLVRGGVAPDHPNIKAVTRVYEKTAEHPEFRFYGNVELGRDLSHDELTRPLPRGHLRGRRADRPAHGHPRRGPARQLGGHRVRRLVQRPPRLPRPRVRPLVRSARSWSGTATSPPTSPGCSRSRARSWPPPTSPTTRSTSSPSRTCARSSCSAGAAPRRRPSRTPSCSSWASMTDADVIVDPGDVELDPLSQAFIECETAHATRQKNVEILHEYSQRVPEGKRRRIVLRFLVSPVEILGRRAGGGHPHLPQRADRGRVRRAARRSPGRPRRRSSAGSSSARSATAGCRSRTLPFDERAGRDPERRRPRPRRTTARCPASTWSAGSSAGRRASSAPTSATRRRPSTSARGPRRRPPAQPADPDRDSLEELVAERRPDAVSYAGWEAIDRVEKAAGEPHGRPRVKLCSFEELLEAAKDRYAGALTRAARRRARRARARRDERMQVKIGVSDSV